MGRVFRRVLSFLLGFIVGISAVAGTLVGAAYWAYKKISLEKVGVEIEGLGDFNSMTIEESVDTILDLFENPQNYSIKDLEENYNFNLEEFVAKFGDGILKNETADDKANLDALKKMNLAYLFTGGIDSFLDSINTRVIFNFLPDSLLSDGTRARLSQYTLRELFSEDPITERLGVFDALGQVKFGGIFPEFFDEVYNPSAHVYTYEYVVNGDNQDKQWLNLLGNLNFGSLLNSFVTGDSDILTELMSGRLTDISDKPLREVFGDIGGIFSEDIGETLKQYVGIFGDAAITDWFILAEDGESYEFSVENVLQEVKLGYLFGYEDKEGVWYDGDTPASGIRKIISDLDVYALYLAYQDGSLPETVIDELGDLSVATLLEEFMGYTRDDNGVWSADNGEKPLNILTALADVSVKSVLGSNGTIIENLLESIRNSVKGYSLGDFASDFMDISKNEQGKWVDANGEELLSVLGGLFSIEVSDLVMDEFSVEDIISILKQAVGESQVGEILGYTKQGDEWFNGDERVSELMAFVSDIKMRNFLDIFLTDFTPSQIVKAIFEDATVGEVLIAFAQFSYDEESGIFYNFKDEETVPALYALKDVKVWELVAAFDSESAYDVFPVLYEIEIGDFVGRYVKPDGQEVLEGYWSLQNFIFSNPIRITGALNKVLSLNLGEMLDPDISAKEILEPLKGITIGEIAQSALGLYKVKDGLEIDWKSEYGLHVFDFMRVLADIPTSIDNIIDFISGDSGEDLEQFLTYMLNEVRVGDFIGDLLGLSYNSNTDIWFSDDTSDQTYAIIEFLLNYQVINDTFEIINSEEKLETIATMVENLEIGHIVEPFMDIHKEAEWTKYGGDLWTLLKDLFGVDLSYVVTLVDDIIKGEKITVGEVIKNISGETRTLGEYLTDFIPEINFKPLEKNVYGIILYQFADIIFDGNAINHNFENRRDYLEYLFGDIKVGHFLEPIGALDLQEDGDEWVSASDNTLRKLRLFNALLNVKLFFIGEFVYDTVSSGVFAYDTLYGEVFGEDTNVGYYVSELFNQNYHQEKQVWTDQNGYLLYSYIRVLYDQVPYAFLNDARYEGFPQAIRNALGKVRIGDLVYDVIMENAPILQVKAYKDLQTGEFVNYGYFTRLFDVVYNVKIDDIYEHLTDGVYWKDLFFKLLVGDYLSDFVKMAVDKLGFYTQIIYDEETNSYFVTEEYNKILTYLFNRSLTEVEQGIKDIGFLKYLTEVWFRDILVGDFFDKGLYHYNSASQLWYDKDEIIPFDFDLYSIVYEKVLSLSVYDLTHSFDLMTVFDNLFLGNAMALTKYAEYTIGGQTIYEDAGKAYTINNGKKQKFAYEIYTDGDDGWYYYDGEYEYILTKQETIWYGTKLFKSLHKVELAKDSNGNYKVTSNDTGAIYPCEYIPLNDVYKVSFDDSVDYFKMYNGIAYQATEQGDFKRYHKNFIVQKLADIQLEAIINGFDIEKMLGGYYVGEIMGYHKGEVEKTAEQLGYRKYDIYKWYKDKDTANEDNRISAMEEVVANIKLQAVFDGDIDFSKEIENLKVKDVIPDAHNVSILKLFADVEMKKLEEKFDELYVGDIMEMTRYTSDKQGIMREVFGENAYGHKIYGKYLLPSTVGGEFNYYIVPESANTPIYVNVVKDDQGWYYINDKSERINLDAELNFDKDHNKDKSVWVDTNDIELIDGYRVIDFVVHDSSGNELGVIEYLGNGIYSCPSVSGLEYLILKDDPTTEETNLKWYRAYANGEQIIEPVDDLIAVFAVHSVHDFQNGNFLNEVINDIKQKVYMGEFFVRAETGVFALFTDDELDEILIEEFAEKCTEKVRNTSLEKLMDAHIITISAENIAKLDNNAVLGSIWKQLTIDQLLNAIIGII